MPSTPLTRRRLLGGGAALAAGAYGAHRLDRGATDATFTAWTPAPGTWPLRRYDPANTANNPNAAPPREPPDRREIVSVGNAGDDLYFHPIVGSDHLVVHGSGFAAYPRGGGDAVRAATTPAPLAGFGPDGRLHVARDVTGRDASDAGYGLVGYGGDDLRETYRVALDTDHPSGMAVGTREVYVGGPDREIRAVDPESGRGWRVGGTMPALADGHLYAAGALRDGTVAYAEREGIDRRLAVGPKRVWSAGFVRGQAHFPAAADGRVVLGSYGIDGGAVVAYDAADGTRLWEPRSLGMDVATPAVVGDRGYVAVGIDGLEAGIVAAIDLATGDTVWQDEVGWYAFSPVVGGDTLVVAGEVRDGHETTTGKVRAYDRATGDVLWTHTLDADPDALALVEDRVLVTAGSSLYELA